MSRRRYSLQFQDQACDLAMSPEYTVLQAARQLGIHPYTLRLWMKKRKLSPRNPPASVESDDVQVLRQQLKQAQAKIRSLELDNTILKKATAFFAKEAQK